MVANVTQPKAVLLSPKYLPCGTGTRLRVSVVGVKTMIFAVRPKILINAGSTLVTIEIIWLCTANVGVALLLLVVSIKTDTCCTTKSSSFDNV